MPAVLLTRPLATSQALAEILHARGYETIIEPLLSITFTQMPRPREKADAVIVTSGNALDGLERSSEETTDLFLLPCFCVGLRTAKKAQALGFINVTSTAGDGAELARSVSAALLDKKGMLLHICGQDIESNAGEQLKKDGHGVIEWPVYTVVPAEQFTSTTTERFKKGKLDSVVVFSTRTAQTLKKLVSQAEVEACCKALAAICLSDAIAAELKPLPWRKLAATPEPTEDAVIACLEKICPVQKMTESASSSRLPRKKNYTLFAGVTLAIIGFVILVLWPHRVANTNVTAGDENAGLRAKVTTLEEKVTSLENRINDLNTRIAQTPSQAPAVLPDFSKTGAADIAKLESDVVALSAALTALQAEVKQSGTDAEHNRMQAQALYATAIAFLQLREAVVSGRSYVEELAAMRVTTRGNDVFAGPLAKLEPYALNGVPSVPALYAQFQMLAIAAGHAVEQASAQTWWQRIVAALKGLIVIRPMDGSSDTLVPNDPVSEIENDLAEGAVATALTTYNSLPTAAEETLKSWHDQAEARQVVDQALHDISTALVATAMPQPAAPIPQGAQVAP